MVHLDDETMSVKKKVLLSDAMKRTSDWIFSQEIPSDFEVHVGGFSFSLHKFPLVSKCGYIQKIVSKSSETDLSSIEISDVPGGAESFELAAKYCYGINFEIGTENIAMLRCVAEYLEMTEEYSVNNLVSRTESYLNEVALKSLAGAVIVLHSSQNFIPISENIKLVNRSIDKIAYIVCKDSEFCGDGTVNSSVLIGPKPVVDWWAEDLTVLRVDTFQRVLVAMMSRGFKQCALGPILMLYAQKSLRGLEIFGKGRKKLEVKEEHEKRVILETIVSLLPNEKNAMSVSFLSMLLRAAIYLETTVACRLGLEKRMGLQLSQAVLDDLLIPSYSFTGDTLFDVDTVQRIMMNYLEYEVDGTHINFEDSDFVLPPQSENERIGKLMECYVAEIASDRNLSVLKFVNLAELIPEQSKVTEDGMYRAIDIYLKAHPDLSDVERKKVCSIMDCQKLSREACAHAAQNDRLPVQTVVQVLYYEQQRLREGLAGAESPALHPKVSSYTTDIHPVPDELSTLKRENQDLKLELLKLKMKMKEMEKKIDDKSSQKPPLGITNYSADKPPLPPTAPKKSFIGSVSKKLGKLVTPPSKTRIKPPKDRRHSVS